MDRDYNANAWGHDSILRYYDKHRLTTKDVYSSEWFFLQQKLRNGIKVLDIGCAKGFTANVLAENLQDFTYVGIDINQKMIDAATAKFPQHRFLTVKEDDYSALADEQFDLVICLGILHIHESWRHTLSVAWKHTQGSLIMDLRETHLPTLEDKNIAYFKMDFDDSVADTVVNTVPYNFINAAEAQQTVVELCQDATKITRYGYLNPISSLAVSPIKKAMTNVYCIEKNEL